MTDVRQNTAYIATVLMQSSAGVGVAGLSGSLTVNLKKAGGAFAPITPTITDRSSGWYDLALTAAHTDTLGLMVFNITGPGVNPNNELQLNVVAAVGADVTSSLSTVSSNLSTTSSGVSSLGSGVNTVGSNLTNANAALSSAGTQAASLDATVAGINGSVGSANTAVGNVSSALTTTNANVSSVGSQVTSVGNTVSSTASAMSGVNVEINNVAADMTTLVSAVSGLAGSILNALMSGYNAPGTVGDGLALGAGLLQSNFYMDNTAHGDNGMTSARLRLFRSAAATAAATPGGTGEGEFATFTVTTTYSGPGQMTSHKVVRTS